MGIRRKGMRRKFTGIRPSRPAPVRKKTTVQCVECENSFETVTEQDGLPINVVSCDVCGVVFNRTTGAVLAHVTPGSDL